ncbi:hypothetical protein, partial [Rahnella perminowiae]|uniref:hypothetical protein n=1 Tax=Rahnella perminowiae TaxID=2816244 RepID=UPI001C254784
GFLKGVLFICSLLLINRMIRFYEISANFFTEVIRKGAFCHKWSGSEQPSAGAVTGMRGTNGNKPSFACGRFL